MKLPRNAGSEALVHGLGRVGYRVQRQRGSHIYLFTPYAGGHHVVLPAHRTIKPGLLNTVLKQVADHHGMTREELLEIMKL